MGSRTMMMDELLQSIATALHEGRIGTRKNRNDPVSAFPQDLLAKIQQDGKRIPQAGRCGMRDAPMGKRSGSRLRRMRRVLHASSMRIRRRWRSSPNKSDPSKKDQPGAEEQDRPAESPSPYSVVAFRCALAR